MAETVYPGRAAAFSPKDSLNRYLLEVTGADVVADVASFHSEESLSQPYRFTVRFTSTASEDAARGLLQKDAVFIMRTPDPD